MRRALAPLLLFGDDDPAGARAKRNTPVHEADPSDSAKRKTTSKTKPGGLPVQTMTDLPSHLGSRAFEVVSLRGKPDTRFIVTSEPTELKAQASAFLELGPEPRVHNRLTAWMTRIATTDANPGPPRLVKFRSSLPILLGDWTVIQFNGGL